MRRKIRVKCIAVRARPGALRDPVLEKGRFYTVIDPEIHTIADETPYIQISDGKCTYERPRHLFGPFLYFKEK